MKVFLCTFGVLLAAFTFTLSPLAQGQSRLSPDDQREFDKYYIKWVNDTRKNDRDDIAKDVGRMQEIMERNHISPNVPFDQLASTGDTYGVRVYQGRLSADEQREFDKYYTKWVNDTRKNDRDDIAKDVRHMQEIMARENIPASVPFDQIASSAYEDNGTPQAYSPRGTWRSRLSLGDQREFDEYYARWLDDTRVRDQDAISRDAGRMQAIMARNNLPADVPFDQIVSAAGSDRTWQGSLGEDDQREFDRSYANWLEDTRKNDRDNIDRDVRRMQDIMARYSIPANVPFDRIASANAYLRH